jgi:hypothetical protein
VALTREKQILLQDELEKYATSTNFIIKSILQKHITKAQRTIELLGDAFAERFDKRPEYLADVVKTARVEIGRHRKLARTIRTMRDKTPFFKPGRMILSYPLVIVNEKTLILQTAPKEEIPIPFDKHSRNQNIENLTAMAKNPTLFGRVRITWNKQGYVDIDIRY